MKIKCVRVNKIETDMNGSGWVKLVVDLDGVDLEDMLVYLCEDYGEEELIKKIREL